MRRQWFLSVSVATVMAVVGTSAQADQVDITNANGTIDDQFMSSNGGLSSDNFAGSEANGVSVWLRARNQGDQGPVERIENLFKIREATGADEDRFAFEFQFSPQDGDEVGDNYFLNLELDNDPSAGTNFTAENRFLAAIFDDDDDDELLDDGRTSGDKTTRSWDDGDSVAIDGETDRASGTVDFNNPTGSRDSSNLPEFVVANSWLAEWDFENFSILGDDFEGAPPNGFFDIRLTASNMAMEELASVQITTQVGEIPVPGSLALLGAGLFGFGFVRARRRR